MEKNEKHLTDEEIQAYFDTLMWQEVETHKRKNTLFSIFITISIVVAIASVILMLVWNTLIVGLFKLPQLEYLVSLIMAVFTFLSLVIAEKVANIISYITRGIFSLFRGQ